MSLFGSRKKEDPALLIQRGEYARAVGVLEKDLKVDPTNLRLRNQLGDAQAAAGNSAEALAAYQRVAQGYATAGFTAKALAIWKKMARLAPSDPELLERIGGAVNRPAGAEPVALPADPAPAAEPAHEGARPLPETPLFPDFAAEEFADVARRMEHRRFIEGDRIVNEGEAGDSLYVIAEGTVRVTIRQEDGELELARLGPGDFFGEVAVLTGKIRTASILACEPCEVLELSADDLDRVCKAHPRVREVMEEFNRKRAELTVEAIVEARLGGAF